MKQPRKDPRNPYFTMQYHKLFEYCTTDCHCAIPKDCTAAAAAASPSTSIAVLFLALIASEVVIVVMCKTIAWYADAMFYSQQEDKKAAQSMQTQMWEKKSRDKPGQQGQDSACPICLIDFGEYNRHKCDEGLNRDNNVGLTENMFCSSVLRIR